MLVPNPTTDVAMLTWESNYRGPVTVRINTLAGRTWQTQTVQKTAATLHQSLSLKALPTGLYLIQVQTTEGTQVRKVLKE